MYFHLQTPLNNCIDHKMFGTDPIANNGFWAEAHQIKSRNLRTASHTPLNYLRGMIFQDQQSILGTLT